MKNTCLGNKQKKKRIAVILYISIAMMTVLLNALAWSSTAFCDAYIAFVFPVWVNTYGRVMGLFPFSVGEWLLVAGLILLAVAVLLLPVAVVQKIRRGSGTSQNRALSEETAIAGKSAKRLTIRKFYIFFAWVALLVCLIMTLNCVILYHASPFSEKYFKEAEVQNDLSISSEEDERDKLAELFRVRNLVVGQCNVLSEQVARDEKGVPVYVSGQNSEVSVKMVDKASLTNPKFISRQLIKFILFVIGFFS